MESDSESEQLRARFEALKIPTGANDGLAKPQLSPTVAPVDRAKLDADLRQRLHELGMSGSDTGTEIDEEELERFLASEDEWYDEFNSPESREELANEVRQLMSQLNGANGPPVTNLPSTRRQDSVRTIISSVPNQYSGDSDADDEGTADEKEWNDQDHLSLSRDSSNRPSREASRTRRERASTDTGSSIGPESGTEEDDDRSITADSDHPGLRTPPTNHHRKTLSADTVGRYEALFQSLETPRALPVETPTDENGPLPPAFAKLQAIRPHTGKIGEHQHSLSDEDAQEPSDIVPGPAPKLDIEGWRASRDDKPDTWCCICNADAAVRCTGCDNDLYCKDCFTKSHPVHAVDAGDHKPMDYTGPTHSS